MASQRKKKLGSFAVDSSGALNGRILGLGLGSTSIVSQEALSQDGRRYLKLIADPLHMGCEIGAAFPKQKEGKHYYSVHIDLPILPVPINAALFPDDDNKGHFNLVWNRRDEPKPAAEATVTATSTSQAQGKRFKGMTP
jgi:uncharacterized protein (DUF736 family)